MQNIIKKYEELRAKIKAYEYAMSIIYWDSSTEAPSGCFELRGKYLGILSEEVYKLQTSDEFVGAVNTLYDNRDKLDDALKHEIVEVKKNNDETKKIPMEEYIEYQVLLSNSENIWAEAKNNNNFEEFKPCLKKIVTTTKKINKYLETEELKGYNVLLNKYENGFTMKEYDEFFDLLKVELVPFVKKIIAKGINYNNSFESKLYPVEKQKEFCRYIEKIMCYDTNRGLMKESEHPFTAGTSSRDVRVTNHYYEDLLVSSIFSAIHELGHATYDQQISQKYDETFCSDGASMAMHESQSRFYENIVGRSREFWTAHFDQLKKIFNDQMHDTTLDDFVKAVNRVEKSLIRTEADELTYPIHIMIRYDIEKMLFNDEIEVEDLPQVWNKMYKDYLGIDVPDDKNGVLQDVHWAGGMFGYFPTYALGSAYAAQFYNTMKAELDVEKAFTDNTTKQINDWLKEKVHKYGSTKYPKEILVSATGEAFNPMYYINYLKDKYTKIYNI